MKVLQLLIYVGNGTKGEVGFIGGIIIFMKNKFIFWVAISTVVMLTFPWLIITFVKGDVGMAACLLLFFAINPIYFIFIGIIAGKCIRKLWGLPLVSAILFLSGTWMFFDMGETAFLIYAGIYFILGIIAMLISGWIYGILERMA